MIEVRKSTKTKRERCNRIVRDEIPGIIAELFCRDPAVWKDLSNGVVYCESCIRFVHHGILKRIHK